MSQPFVIVVIGQVVRQIFLFDIGLRVGVREQIATLLVKHECTYGLETEVFGHKFTHLFEEASETPLCAHFRSQLKCVDDSLLFLINLLFRLNLLDLHGQVGAEDFQDLLVGLMEAHVLVLPLDDPRLTLNHEHYLIVAENDWVGQMRLVLQTIPDLVNLLETWLCDCISLTDGLAVLVLEHQSCHIHVVHVRSVAHNGADQVGTEDEDRAVREGYERL